MESRCHLGLNIVYDTVSNLSWAVDVRMHSINTVIDRLLSQPWAPSEEIGRQVPEAISQDDCVVCLEQFSFLDWLIKSVGMLFLGIR
jgi:lipase ATG15